MRGPVPETAMHAHTMTTPPPCFTDEAVSFGSFAVPFFSPHFCFHLDIGSSLSHRSINTVPKLFWLTFVLFCKLLSCLAIFGAGQRFASCSVASVILCQSLLRTVDCQRITPAFWRLMVILQTRLLGFIFTAFMICLSWTTVVFSADQVVVGCWWFTNSCFLHALCICCSSNWLPLFSIQIACFSLKVSSLVFILVCVCHRRMQDSEYRCNGYNWYDTFPAFNTGIINATGHSWSLRKSREAINIYIYIFIFYYYYYYC